MMRSISRGDMSTRRRARAVGIDPGVRFAASTAFALAFARPIAPKSTFFSSGRSSQAIEQLLVKQDGHPLIAGVDEALSGIHGAGGDRLGGLNAHRESSGGTSTTLPRGAWTELHRFPLSLA